METAAEGHRLQVLNQHPEAPFLGLRRRLAGDDLIRDLIQLPERAAGELDRDLPTAADDAEIGARGAGDQARIVVEGAIAVTVTVWLLMVTAAARFSASQSNV
jgi:hypothetical protein